MGLKAEERRASWRKMQHVCQGTYRSMFPVSVSKEPTEKSMREIVGSIDLPGPPSEDTLQQDWSSQSFLAFSSSQSIYPAEPATLVTVMSEDV